MKAIRLFLFSAFLLLQSFDLLAQEPVYRQFTNEQGLPSSEVYDVLQDKRGYMWFATDQGIVRYDGYNFTTYNESNGLPENTVFDLELDKQGNIWVNSLRGHLAYFDGEKIQPYRFNHVLDSLFEQNPASLYLFNTYHIFSPDSVVINTVGHDLVSITGDGAVYKPLEKDSTFNHLFLLDQGKVLINGSSRNYHPTYKVHSSKSSFTFELPLLVYEGPAHQFKVKHHKNRLFISDYNIIYEIDFEGKIVNSKTFNSIIYALNIDNEDNIWIGTSTNGLYKFSNLNLTEKPSNYFKTVPISSFGFDHEGGVWITSLSKGVFYIPLKSNFFYNRLTGQDFNIVRDLFIDSESVCWLALSRGRLARLMPDQSINIIELDTTINFEINDILFHQPSESILIATSVYLYQLKMLPGSSPPQYDIKMFDTKRGEGKYRSILDLFIDKSGALWSGQFDGLYRFYPNLEVAYSSSQTTGFRMRIEDISQIGDTIYFATLNGLYSFHDSTFTHLGDKFDLLRKRITDIFALNDTLLIGTKANGLLMLTSQGLNRFDQSTGLLSNTIKNIGANKEYLLIGTNNGISLIKRSALKQGKSFESFNINSGMHANEINSIESLDGVFYLATANGLQVIDPQFLVRPDIQMPIYLTKLLVNQKPQQITKQLQVKHSQNDIQIDYFAISFRDKSKQTYRHRLLGLEEDWIVNQNTTAQYPYLPSGQYIFEVSVRNGNGIWNPSSARLSIHVLKPYWAKPWFIVIVLLLFIGLIVALFYWRIKAANKHNQLLYDINWYQQEALINQMNPHFLFNSLNTVHRYVLQNDRLASSRYLTKFANLMRRILENSQEKSITIAAEKEALNLYLELESARFKDKFNYQIHVDERIAENKVKIPVFIVQPIVENAIWHGLMPSDKPGQVAIYFERETYNSLKIRVVDNGIGRKEAAVQAEANKTTHKKSLGLSIIKRRIELINIQEKTNISLSYKDLIAEDKSAAGTEVTVYFPNFLKTNPV